MNGWAAACVWVVLFLSLGVSCSFENYLKKTTDVKIKQIELQLKQEENKRLELLKCQNPG